MKIGSGAGGLPRSGHSALAALLLIAACQRAPGVHPPDSGRTSQAPTAATEDRRPSGGGRPSRPVLDAAVAGLSGHQRFPMVFPLRQAPGGRHFEDQRGVPFLIKGETAWLALANLTEGEQETYLADRAARGFNLVEVMLINHDYTRAPNPLPPANRHGEQPFLRPGNLATPNDAYFDRALTFVDRAAAQGIVVLLAPNYLGFDGGPEGWWEALNGVENTREVCAGFGRYLGARFRNRPNVLWLAGGDFAPPPRSEGEARHLALFAGIRAAGANQPWTGHWNVQHRGGISTDQALFAPLMEANGVYQYVQPYRFASRAYDVRPPRPVFLLESTYEHEHPRDDTQPFRKAWWWSMLSGGGGTVWSNHFLWMCESSRGTYQASYGDTDRAVSSWRAELDSPGTHQMQHLHRFFEALPWYRLVPAGPTAGQPALVTAGQRGREEFIAAASTREGDLLVAYVPPTGADHRRFVLDLSGLAGPARGRWFDPVAGTFVDARPLSPNSGGVEFEVPGKNASGLDDWVLVIETL
jgi:hypothetical protein